MTGTIVPSHGSESSVGVFGAKLTSLKQRLRVLQSLCIGSAWFEASVRMVFIFEHSVFICYTFVCGCTVFSLAVYRHCKLHGAALKTV